jgi:hypothetical protein
LAARPVGAHSAVRESAISNWRDVGIRRHPVFGNAMLDNAFGTLRETAA